MSDDAALRRAALFSAYSHACIEGGAGQFMLPQQVRPDPLDIALEPQRIGADRRYLRMALGKLLGAGFGFTDRWGQQPAVVSLAETAALSLSDFLVALRPITPPGIILSVPAAHSAAIISDLDPLNLLVGSAYFEAAAQNYVYSKLQAEGGCSILHKATVVAYDTKTLVTKVTVSVLVKPDSFKTLSASLDPRSWPVIGPDFFPQAYKVETDSDGDCVFAGDTPKPDPYLENTIKGEVPWRGPFYEVFRWNPNQSTASEFCNLLWIDFRKDAVAKTVTMDFRLHRSLESTVYWSRLGGGIDIDDGTTTAVPWDQQHDREDLSGNPTWWKVTGSKRLRFTDRTHDTIGIERPYDLGRALNYLTPALVTMFLELAMKEGACRKVVGPP
jgi:hypothetical protein